MICIIQARTNSYRLPKKILRKIGNKRMIELVVNQVKKSKKINKIIIATSKTKNDLKLIKILKNKKIEYSRGSLNNVAERFKDVIEKYKMKSFIRISLIAH